MVMNIVQCIVQLFIQAVEAVLSLGSALVCGEFLGCASFFVVLAVLGNLVICPLVSYCIRSNLYPIRCIFHWFLLAVFLQWTKSDVPEEYVSICCLSDKTTQYSSLLLFLSYLIVLFFSDSTKMCKEMCGSHSIVYFRASYYRSCYFLS